MAHNNNNLDTYVDYDWMVININQFQHPYKPYVQLVHILCYMRAQFSSKHVSVFLIHGRVWKATKWLNKWNTISKLETYINICRQIWLLERSITVCHVNLTAFKYSHYRR